MCYRSLNSTAWSVKGSMGHLIHRARNSWGWTPISSWSGSDHYPWDKIHFSPPAQRWRKSLKVCWEHRYLKPLLLTPVSSQPEHKHTHSHIQKQIFTQETIAHSIFRKHTVSLFPELLLCWSESCLVSASVATASVSYLRLKEMLIATIIKKPRHWRLLNASIFTSPEHWCTEGFLYHKQS